MDQTQQPTQGHDDTLTIPSARGGVYSATIAEIGLVFDALADYARQSVPPGSEAPSADPRTWSDVARELVKAWWASHPDGSCGVSQGVPCDVFSDVLRFSRKFGHHIQPLPAVPPPAVVNLRVKLIVEEFVELLQAICTGDLPGVADGGVDLMYVVIGTLWAFGIAPQPVWNAVQQANMAKSQDKRDDGKTTKPIGWMPPDIAGILARQEPIDPDALVGPGLAGAGACGTGVPTGGVASGGMVSGDGNHGGIPVIGRVDLLGWLESVKGSLCYSTDRLTGWIVIMPEDGDREEWRLAGATPAAAIEAAMAAWKQQESNR